MNKLGRWKFLMAPFLALLMTFGLGNIAKGEVTSGSVDFDVVFDKTETMVGGDPVNFTIRVLDEDGKINQFSDGELGDVAFKVVSQLSLWGTMDINGNRFAADQDAFAPGWHGAWGQPVQTSGLLGLINSNLNYTGNSGTDTITVNMHEVISVMVGVNDLGPVVASKQYQVTVGPGDPVINEIIDVEVLAPLANDPNVDFFALINTTLSSVSTTSNAGQNINVTIGCSDQTQNGTVKVQLIGLPRFTGLGINNGWSFAGGLPDGDNAIGIFQNNACGTVYEAEADVVMGVGTAQFPGATLTKAGRYKVVAVFTPEAGPVVEAYQRESEHGGDIDGDLNLDEIVLHRIEPLGATKLALSTDRTLVQPAIFPAQVIFTVRTQDQHNNRTSCGTVNRIVNFNNVSGIGAVSNLTIPANRSQIRTATAAGVAKVIDVGDFNGVLSSFGAAAGSTVLFSASSSPLTVSNIRSLTYANNGALTADPIVGPLGGCCCLVDSDATPNTETIVAGNQVIVGVDNLLVGPGPSQIPIVHQVYLKVLRTGEIAYANLQAETVDVDGDGFINDFFAAFQLKTATVRDDLLFGDNTAGFIAPTRLPWSRTDGTIAFNVNGLTVQTGTPATMQLVDSVGTAATQLDAFYTTNEPPVLYLYPDLRAIRGNHIRMTDAYGNVVMGGVGVTIVSTSGSLNGLQEETGNLFLDVGLLSSERYNINYPTGFAGSDSITITPNVGAASPITVTMLKVGYPWTQINLTGINLTEVTMPQNGIIPIQVETVNAAGDRIPCRASDLRIYIDPATGIGNLATADGFPGLAHGAIIDTFPGNGVPDNSGDNIGGRLTLRALAGLTTGTFTVTVENAGGTIISNPLVITVIEAPLVVDPLTVEVGAGATKTAKAVGGTAPYTVASSDTSVATATVSDGTITITGVAEGSCTITVSDSSSPAESRDISVTVTPGGVPQPPPTEPPNVGLCDATCQATAPVTATGVDFSYTAEVTILVGAMDATFTQVWWLNSSCEYTTDYAEAASGEMALSCSVDAPNDAAWLFWFVTAEDLATLDWENGAYDLLFYSLD
jgi:hypothetical protein